MKRQVKKRNKLFSKAFSQVRAGGSLNPDVYTEGGEALKRASLLSTSPLGKREKEPHGVFGVGSNLCLSFFEHYIHHLGLSGNRKALRKALVEYLKLWGVKC